MLFQSICLVLTLSTLSAQAASVFNLDMSVGNTTQSRGYDKADSLINAFKFDEIKNLFPSYTGVEAVSMTMNFRGLPMFISYAGSGSTTMTLSVPDIGLTQTFTGVSRDDSNAQFKNWLKKDGGEALNKIMKKLAEVSPQDPIAGNPNSLMSKMMANDFAQVAFPNAARITSDNMDSPEARKNVAGVEARLGRFSQSGVDADALTIPFSYTVRFDSDPRYQWSFYLPVTYVQMGQAKSYNASLGSGFRLPLNDSWSLTPAVGIGVVGSMDLGSVGQVASGSLTSGYDIKVGTCHLGITNMLGMYKTLEVKIDDYKFNPDLTNYVARNALMLSMPHMVSQWHAETEVFVIDTRFFGSPLYMKQYNEIGASIGTDKNSPGLSKYIRVGGAYLYSSKDKGYSANLGYSF